MATDTRAPTSDVDFTTGTWSGSAGTRYTLVNDYPDSSGSTVLTVGTTAGYGILGRSAFSIPAGSTSISVQVLYYDYKNGSQSCTSGSCILVGGTRYNSATHNPGNGVANIAQRTDNWATNPGNASAAWTVEDVNGTSAHPLQTFGFNSGSDANPTISYSSVVLQVTYTPPVTGTMAVTETADVAAASGTVQWIGNLAATGMSDTAAFSGTVSSGGVSGDLAATEPADAAAASGTVEWRATLAATGPIDTASASGTVAWVGQLAATESPDIAAFSGTVSGGGGGISGDMAAVEAANALAGTGTVSWVGNLAAIGPSDSFTATGILGCVGNMAAASAQDMAHFTGTVPLASIIHARVGHRVGASVKGGVGYTEVGLGEA